MVKFLLTFCSSSKGTQTNTVDRNHRQIPTGFKLSRKTPEIFTYFLQLRKVYTSSIHTIQFQH